MQPDGFRELVRCAQAGDAQAREHLFELIQPFVTQLARGYEAPSHTGESSSDLAQNVCLQLSQRLAQFRAAETAGLDDETVLIMFRAWVAQTVERLAQNWNRDARALKRRPPGKLLRLQVASPADSASQAAVVDPSDSEPTPSQNVQADEQARLVQVALEEIPDRTDRQIVRLRFFEELSLHQIAERLGLSYDKVRQHYQNGMELLERELRGLL